MQYFNHITLLNGGNIRSYRKDVSDATIAVLSPWLDRAIASAQEEPLPVPDLRQYACQVLEADGGIMATITAPSGPYKLGEPHKGLVDPLVTIAVAKRDRRAGNLWEVMTTHFQTADGLLAPAAPWCAVGIYPQLLTHKAASKWLADFERCVAWTWLLRNDLGADNDDQRSI